MTYDTNDFERDVIERSRTLPVLVDFWAEWCGPCKVLGPVLEKLAGDHSDEWALVKLDTEAFPHISAQYGIRSIPNVKLFVDGEVIDEFVGALPEPQVVEWLRKAIPSRYRMQMADARRMLSDSGAGPALEILRTIIAAEPDNQEALVLTARALLSTDPAQAATSVEPVQLGSPHYDEAEAIRTLAATFARVDDPGLLPEGPVKERYLQAFLRCSERRLRGGAGGVHRRGPKGPEVRRRWRQERLRRHIQPARQRPRADQEVPRHAEQGPVLMPANRPGRLA